MGLKVFRKRLPFQLVPEYMKPDEHFPPESSTFRAKLEFGVDGDGISKQVSTRRIIKQLIKLIHSERNPNVNLVFSYIPKAAKTHTGSIISAFPVGRLAVQQEVLFMLTTSAKMIFESLGLKIPQHSLKKHQLAQLQTSLEQQQDGAGKKGGGGGTVKSKPPLPPRPGKRKV